MQFNKLFYNYNKYFLLLLDVFLVNFSFIVLAWAKPRTIVFVLPQYTPSFLIYFLIFLGISIIIGKYDLVNFKKIQQVTISVTLNTFIVLSIVTILLFAFKLNTYSRLLVFGTILLCYLLELIAFRFIYSWLRENKYLNTKKTLSNYISVNHEPIPIVEKPETIESTSEIKSTRKQLINIEAGPNVYEYIAEHINIEDESVVLTSTSTAFNVTSLPGDKLRTIINLKKVNDMRYINKFFEAVNEKLNDAGIFIGCVETSKQRYMRIGKKFPGFIRQIVFFGDFLFHRVMPKVAILKKIYFNITLGAKRTVSKAEVLGRLVSCGFEIIEYNELNNLTYFVVIKTSKPAFDLNPSLGLIYKTPKTGKNGKIIYIYKFRTMHPFSEYLQDYVLMLSSVTGHPKDDFRLTNWGKFMRKYWLDELPQLINILKGELKLFGIRPLSDKALKNYPEDVKKMRIKVKPGCIPPYIALLKDGANESIEAEKIYLMEKEKSPLMTDIKYLSMAILNIITNKVRSK